MQCTVVLLDAAGDQPAKTSIPGRHRVSQAFAPADDRDATGDAAAEVTVARAYS